MHETLIKWILVMFILFISNKKNELKIVIQRIIFKRTL